MPPQTLRLTLTHCPGSHQQVCVHTHYRKTKVFPNQKPWMRFAFFSKNTSEMQPLSLETKRLTSQPGPIWGGKSTRINKSTNKDWKAFQVHGPLTHQARHTDFKLQNMFPHQYCLSPWRAQLLLHLHSTRKQGDHAQMTRGQTQLLHQNAVNTVLSKLIYKFTHPSAIWLWTFGLKVF